MMYTQYCTATTSRSAKPVQDTYAQRNKTPGSIILLRLNKTIDLVDLDLESAPAVAVMTAGVVRVNVTSRWVARAGVGEFMQY